MPLLKPKFFHIALLALIFVWPTPLIGLQEGDFCHINHRRTAVVRKVQPNGNLRLESGETVRLIGVMPVKQIENPASFITRKLNKLASQAVELLRQHVEGQKINLYQRGRTHDRYGRLLAHVTSKKGEWLQGLLLQKGLARSFSYKDNHACMGEMLKLEAMARKQQHGLWHYRIFRPQQALQDKQLMRKRYRFTLVEGRVRKVVSVKKWVFVNFGDNWRDDFTIAIKRKYKKAIEHNGLELAKLEGRLVRVRGWIERWNGPLIKVTHKQQIEVLTEK